MESGQDVFESLKDLGTGQKRPWYPAIKAAYAFAQAGQLKDLKQLIMEAPCRHDPLFQWGIIQLLSEIAVNPMGAVATRQQAITLLGHLSKVDEDWGHDESIKAWMHTIITMLGSAPDQSVNTIAVALLQNIDQYKNGSIQCPYPLTTRLPIPASSAVLAKVHNIPFVEYDLHKLRLQRLKEAHLQVYIPPMAKANLQARDDDFFSLMAKMEEFLASDRQVMLVLGDSGAGKSTFNKHLELVLWQSYTRGDRIPVFINLPIIDEPQQDMIEKQLKFHNFSDDQIRELKQHRQLILICDGYDESQQLVNLHKTNSLNQPGQWNTKMVISCRSQYLGQDYHRRFMPQGSGHNARLAPELFQEAAITPFSEEQIAQYIGQYVPLESRIWTTQDYMDKLAIIPNLLDLVKNPFVLTLALEVLPLLVVGKQDLSTIRINRAQLYDTFVVYWLDVNKRRLESMTLSNEDRRILDQLLDAGFISMGTEYSTNLASAIFEQQGGNPIVQYIHLKDKMTWKAEFFRPDPEIRLLRESSPLSRTGSLFQFLHRSMQEYFYSRTIFDPSTNVENGKSSPQADHDYAVPQTLNPHGPLFKHSLLTEPSIIQFLCERVKQYPDFKKQLRAVIELSKTDLTATTAAANAITILVRAGVGFNGAGLRGIRIPGADLSGGQLDSAQLQDADLTDVTFVGSWLRQADLSGAQMGGVRFGELPFLKEKCSVNNCVYSSNGRLLAVSGLHKVVRIYDATTWNIAYQHSIDSGRIYCIAFSPDNQQLVYGNNRNVHLWNFANKDTVLNMVGHTGVVRSVAFSPCGKQLASASKDKTVRLWNSETGECVFVLEGHTGAVSDVTYSSDGQMVVSGSRIDETIRVWDPETGEPVICRDVAHENFSRLAISADGQWVAVALKDKIQIKNVVTGEPGPVLNSKSQADYMAFSSNAQWIVTANANSALQLWDTSSGRLTSSFSGHTNWISTCSFSPCDPQIASGDNSGYVRLWEMDASQSVSDLHGPITPIHTVTYFPDGRSILSGSKGQKVQQWDCLTGVPATLPLKIPDDASSFSLSPNSNQTATGHADGTIRLWNRQVDAVDCILLGHSRHVFQLAYSPCGRWVVSACLNEVRLWDLHTGKHPGVITQVETPRFGTCCIAFTPTSEIALANGNNTLCLYDPRAQDPCTILKEMSIESDITSLDCSFDGQEVAIGAYNGTIYLWDFQSDKPRIDLQGHGHFVRYVAYSPCGKWILSRGDDKMVRIWRFIMGEIGCWSCVSVVRGCSDSVTSLAWNPVMALEFVTGCRDGSVRVWRIAGHDDTNEGNISVRMLWSNDVGVLCASDLTFKGAKGLSPIVQKLLVQRGAIDDSSPLERHKSSARESD